MPRGGGGNSRGYRSGGMYLRAAGLQALEALRVATIDSGFAVALAVWRTTYERLFKAKPTYFAALSRSLVRRGLVQRYGRGRDGQYCLASDPRPATPEFDLAKAIYDVVLALCNATLTAVTFRQIQDGLAARDCTFTRSYVQTRLRELCRGRKLERIDVLPAHTKPVVGYWRPAGSDVAPPKRGRMTHRQMAREAIFVTVNALPWPPTVREVKAWGAAHPTHPAAKVLGLRLVRSGGRFGSLIHAIWNEDGVAPQWRLIKHSSPLQSDGGIISRMGPPGLGIESRATARFIDLCYHLRPLEELESCSRIPDESRDLRIPSLAALADVRMAHLRHGVKHGMSDVCGDDAVPWAAIADRVHRGADVLREWRELARPSQHAKSPRWLRNVEYAERTLQALDSLTAPAADACEFSLAGYAGTRELRDMEAWTKELLIPEGRAIRNMNGYLENVRRFPRTRTGRGPIYGEGVLCSMLDVGDALDALAETTSHAELAVLLRTAVDVMGRAVRDPAMLRWLLGELPRSETLYRLGATVALGAMGADVQISDAMRDARDRAGLNAYLLSVALSPATPEIRAQRIKDVAGAVTAPLLGWVHEVAERVEQGDTVSAIM